MHLMSRLSAMFCLCAGLILCCGMLAADETASDPSMADPMDWPHWRGPEMNGISREKGLVDSWSPKGKGENLLWKRDDLAGRSTPIVMRGRLYTIVRDQPGTNREGEKVVCVDAATGETKWENRWNTFLSDVPDTRIGWSSVVGDPVTGNIYAQGVNGYFQCINGETGESLWSHSLSEEYGLLSTYGGRTNFPTLHGNLIIASAVIIGWGEMARPAHRFIAFDKRNGQPVWFSGTRPLPEDTTYSTPITTVINGQAQMIFGSSDGALHSFQPQTGKEIWNYYASPRGINTTPLVVGNKVFCGHSEEDLDDNTQGLVFALDASKSGDLAKGGELWRKKQLAVGKSAPIMVDGKLIAVEDSGTLLVLDPETGNEIANKKIGTMMTGSPTYADGKIYVCAANGRWFILKLNGNNIDTVHQLRLNNEEVHSSPVISHGRIYLQTMNAIYCIGKPDQTPSFDPRPVAPKENPVEADSKPAVVQLVPVESILSPGMKQPFQVRLFNAQGQYLKTVPASETKFSIKGNGSIGADGRFTSPADMTSPGTAVVTAEVGGLKGTSRIRVVPGFPWKFDFSNGEVPEAWVGIRYRHVPLDFDFFKSLEARDPLAAQLYIYLTSGFVNSGRPALKYDNSTPQQQWSEFLRFLELLQTVTNLEQAKQKLDPSLKLLVDEKFLAKWTWNDKPGIQLSVEKGSRKIDPAGGVMCKITTIPKGMRSQGWMGQTDHHDYTIQADVYGAIKNGKLPDIGLVAQRYTFDMMGSSQQLQIRTWPPVLSRMSKTIPFTWKPNTWYTMKFQASVEGKKAVLRGKVWVRGEAEPADWQVVAEDEEPNVIGSPGLFANATNAEVFYDNILVNSNK